MARIVVNDHVDAGLALLFMSVVVAILLLGLRAGLRAWRLTDISAREAPRIALAAE
jgi:carbon starvation protein